MSTLTVLAGPNGVGKTQYSSFLKHNNFISVEVVNLDLIYDMALDRISGIYDVGSIPRKAHGIFKDLCNEAIKNNQDFCYECNFRLDQIENIGLFQNAGYDLNLIYMYLLSIKQSEERVLYRVVELKGNSVDSISIERNFKEGLANLDEGFKDFTKVLIVDNSIDNYKINSEFTADTFNIKMEVNNGVITSVAKDFPPEGLKIYLPNIDKEINTILKEGWYTP